MKNDNLTHRIKAKTPLHFKRIIKIALTLGAVGGALVALPDSIELPAIIKTIGGYFIAIGVVGAAIAKTAKED